MRLGNMVLSQGEFIAKEALTFPFEERGLQFGDGVYEVISFYHGQYYLMDEHIQRLFRSLSALKIQLEDTPEAINQQLTLLLEKNAIDDDGYVYLQISRGSAPRSHNFPLNTRANFYAYVVTQARKHAATEKGVAVVSYPDERWKHCHIKSLNLLPNVLAKQFATEHHCYEAILHKAGTVTEGSSSNIYLVHDGGIYTHPSDGQILHGCVRIAIERFAAQLGVKFNETAFTLEAMGNADELFLTSTTSEVLPIVMFDGQAVNGGNPGPITRALQQSYAQSLPQ